MRTKIFVKKTLDISKTEFELYLSKFNSIFKKKVNYKSLISKYKSGYKGFSYHSFAYDYDDNLCAAFTVIPFKYNFGSYNRIISLGCDAFVDENSRKDELLLYKLYKKILIEIQKDNIELIISIPNPKAKKYWKVLAKWTTIGQLKLRLFPINLFGLKFFWRFLFLFLFKILHQKDKEFRIYIENDNSFNKNRFYGYKRFNNFFFKRYSENKFTSIYIF